MKLVTLKFPLGRTVRVSNAAAEFAIAYDKIARHPAAAPKVLPALDELKQLVPALENLEKRASPETVSKVVALCFK